MLRSSVILLAVALATAACGPENVIKPAPSASPAPGEEAAQSSAAGITIVARTDAWPGTEGVHDDVTTMRVSIRNDSAEPLKVQYSRFQLVAPDGATYAALPPFAIEGTTQKAVGGPIATPGFGYTGFSVAPFYSPVYPGFGVYGGAFGYDPLYYGTYYDYWRTVQLPTETMLELAMPEGVLDPGGSVDGFLYFQKVAETQERVQFRAELVTPDGRELGTLTIPFVVEED